MSLFILSCGTSPSSPSIRSGGEDSSASGIVASVFGGALSASVQSGGFNFTNTCPTILTSGAGCTSAANIATLDFSNCSSTGSSAVWNGYTRLSFSGATTLACGTFPTPTTDAFQRQFVDNSGTASTTTRTSALGTAITIDDTTTGVNQNYEHDHFDGTGTSGLLFSNFNSGAGKIVNFVAGARVSIQALEHISNSTIDFTVAGTLPVTESGTGANMSWAANVGTIAAGACSAGLTIYGNVSRLMGTTCFQNVTFSKTCCAPISGTILTSFATTSQSGGSANTSMSGTSERLTFSGCGSAVFTDHKGNTSLVSLPHCL